MRGEIAKYESKIEKFYNKSLVRVTKYGLKKS
jgi:hypothetical protein